MKYLLLSVLFLPLAIHAETCSEPDEYADDSRDFSTAESNLEIYCEAQDGLKKCDVTEKRWNAIAHDSGIGVVNLRDRYLLGKYRTAHKESIQKASVCYKQVTGKTITPSLCVQFKKDRKAQKEVEANMTDEEKETERRKHVQFP